MAEEQSIKDQIAAMEGWAIKAKQNIDSGKYEEAEELLRTVNTQGRRLEWRGGERGLKHLPEMNSVNILKKKISQARSAAQEAQNSINYFGKIAKKEGKNPAETAAIKRKETNYKNEIVKNVSILIKELIDAKTISDSEPWFDPEVLVEKSNLEILFTLLRCRDFYGHFSEAFLAKIIKRINFKNVHFGKEPCTLLTGAQLQGLDLQEVNFALALFRVANLAGANLRGANLMAAKFYGANLTGTIFIGADLSVADFSGARIKNANFSGANLTSAIFTNADFQDVTLTGANIDSANFQFVTNLSAEQLHSARNWQKARNIPAGAE